jgi:hypothetical protein
VFCLKKGFLAMRLLASLILSAGLLISCTLAYCPDFMQNQTACSCIEYVDGAIIRCNGPDGPMMVEKLKKTQTEVRELALENANILEVLLKGLYFNAPLV